MAVSKHLKIAIPKKGRLKPLVIDLLSRAGFSKVKTNANTLFVEESFSFSQQKSKKSKEIFVEFIFLRAGDIPEILDRGICDLGITGSDIVEEQLLQKKIFKKNIQEIFSLNLGKCNLCLAINDKDSPKKFQGKNINNKKIATSFPFITAKYFKEKKVKIDIIEMSGSVETSIKLGIADAITDLVQTGNTLAANELVDIETLFSSETYLYANQKSYFDNKEAIDFFIKSIQGIIIADQYSILEYNIREKYFDRAKEITPGYNSPTVNKLDNGWLSIKSMVKKSEVIRKMEQLTAISAEAIFEIEIKNCRL